MNDGECKAFKREAIEVCGLTDDDQRVIDEQSERGVQACRWKRPEPRTPSCADLRAEIAALRATRAAMPGPAPPVKKKPIWRRVLGR